MPSTSNLAIYPAAKQKEKGSAFGKRKSTASGYHMDPLAGGTHGWMSDKDRLACLRMIPQVHVAVDKYKTACQCPFTTGRQPQ